MDEEEDCVETVETRDGVIFDRQEDGTIAHLYPDGHVCVTDGADFDASNPFAEAAPSSESARASLKKKADAARTPPTTTTTAAAAPLVAHSAPASLSCDPRTAKAPPPAASAAAAAAAAAAPAAPGSTIYVRTGYLEKEGGSVRTWHRRFFVLTFDARLIYYEGQGGKRLNEINLSGAQVHIPIVAKKPHYFHVFAVPPSLSGSANKRSKYVLCAQSEKERDEWVADIRRVAETHQTPVPMLPAPSGLLQRVAALASTNVIRQMVSKKKIRYKEYGYDLDLTYLSARIIAMGYPSEGTEAVYRNRYEDVYRFLEQFHTRHYKVYNLCSERAYPPNRFHNRVAIYPFEDHNVPSLESILSFCNDVYRWLNADESNIVAVHCKAGKGRTGLMLACYLLFSGEAKSAEEAIQTYAELRTEDHKGITVRCQLQYVKYFEHVVQTGLPTYAPRHLHKIVMYTTPNFDPTGGCNPYFYIQKDSENIFCSKPPDNVVPYVKNSDRLEFRVDLPLKADIRIEFFDQDTFTEDDDMFYLWFNTAFVPASGTLRFDRHELDLSSKDKKHRKFDEKFAVELIFHV